MTKLTSKLFFSTAIVCRELKSAITSRALLRSLRGAHLILTALPAVADLGTEIDEKWWKRYRKNKFFARGNGEYWIDDTALFFRRYLTKNPIVIPLANVVEVKIGISHAGRWLLGARVLKLIWEKDGMMLSSGFIFSEISKKPRQSGPI